MKRHIFSKLLAWKTDKKRKPLILMGARQVGKTTLLKYFGKTEYKNFIYLNFEENTSYKRLFEGTLDPKAILNALSIELNTEITPSETLIIFDEIQECPNALNSLKYFNEQANDYHLCAAGSLLSVKLLNTKGFPVGKVNFLHLYPLNFNEFLEAINEIKLKTYLEKIEVIEPLPSNLHDKLIQYFKIYLFVGGMPEAISEYVDSHDFNKVRTVQNAIMNAYSLDFAKHAPKDNVMKINLVWNSISSQLAKENKKFMYSLIRTGARAKEFEIAMQWLLEAGLIHKVYDVTTPKLPLDAHAIFDFFKVYLVDVGLLGAKTDLSPKIIIHGNELFQEFRGSFIENYVVQEFARNDYGLYYWTSAGKAELDFVFHHDGFVFPLEVKSGSSDHKKSLRVYAEKYHPKLLIRSSPMNLKKDGSILNCPLYLISDLKRLINISIL